MQKMTPQPRVATHWIFFALQPSPPPASHALHLVRPLHIYPDSLPVLYWLSFTSKGRSVPPLHPLP